MDRISLRGQPTARNGLFMLQKLLRFPIMLMLQ